MELMGVTVESELTALRTAAAYSLPCRRLRRLPETLGPVLQYSLDFVRRDLQIRTRLCHALAWRLRRTQPHSRLGECLKSSRNIESIAVEVGALYDHVTKVDANSKDNPSIIQEFAIGCF